MIFNLYACTPPVCDCLFLAGRKIWCPANPEHHFSFLQKFISAGNTWKWHEMSSTNFVTKVQISAGQLSFSRFFTYCVFNRSTCSTFLQCIAIIFLSWTWTSKSWRSISIFALFRSRSTLLYLSFQSSKLVPGSRQTRLKNNSSYFISLKPEADALMQVLRSPEAIASLLVYSRGIDSSGGDEPQKVDKSRFLEALRLASAILLNSILKSYLSVTFPFFELHYFDEYFRWYGTRVYSLNLAYDVVQVSLIRFLIERDSSL